MDSFHACINCTTIPHFTSIDTNIGYLIEDHQLRQDTKLNLCNANETIFCNATYLLLYTYAGIKDTISSIIYHTPIIRVICIFKTNMRFYFYLFDFLKINIIL